MSSRRLLVNLCALGLVLAASVGTAAPRYLIGWTGNTLEWNKKLGIDELRAGCSSEPARCVKSVDTIARAGGVNKITLSISNDSKLVADYALQYSESSLSEPRLLGIGIDDFVSKAIGWQHAGTDVGQLVRNVIANTKAKNPKLAFGITLYEDQVKFAILQDKVLPPEVRAGVDRVSLFIHFQRNSAQYASYVQETKRLFPKAVVMAGAYAYDRIDNLPCAQGSKDRCSAAQELDLFGSALRIQVDLMARGVVGGIELYPNNFGGVEKWYGWDDASNCTPARRKECVDTTMKMQEMALQALH